MALVVKVIPIKAELFDSAKVMKNIEGALDKAGKRMVTRFKKTTEGWKHGAPDFKHEVEMGKDASVWAGPVGSDDMVEKWARLDNGADPHPIDAKNAPYMVFPFQGPGRSYSSSTQPRIFRSKGWEKVGPVLHTKHVEHPGFVAREWSQAQVEIETDSPNSDFMKDLQAAIDEGLK